MTPYSDSLTWGYCSGPYVFIISCSSTVAEWGRIQYEGMGRPRI